MELNDGFSIIILILQFITEKKLKKTKNKNYMISIQSCLNSTLVFQLYYHEDRNKEH